MVEQGSAVGVDSQAKPTYSLGNLTANGDDADFDTRLAVLVERLAELADDIGVETATEAGVGRNSDQHDVAGLSHGGQRSGHVAMESAYESRHDMGQLPLVGTHTLNGLLGFV